MFFVTNIEYIHEHVATSENAHAESQWISGWEAFALEISTICQCEATKFWITNREFVSSMHSVGVKVRGLRLEVLESFLLWNLDDSMINSSGQAAEVLSKNAAVTTCEKFPRRLPANGASVRPASPRATACCESGSWRETSSKEQLVVTFAELCR